MTRSPTRPASLDEGSETVHVLHPGDVKLGRRGDRLETLLGSCVAIILTDPRRTVGAMCHFVHSCAPRAETTRRTAHADPALDEMFSLLHKSGINPLMCEAYLYGGANMFPQLFRHMHVGACNTRWAEAALAEQDIPIVAHDVGGTAYRRLSWRVGTQAPQVIGCEPEKVNK